MTNKSLADQVSDFKRILMDSSPEDYSKAKLIFAELFGLSAPRAPSPDTEMIDLVGIKSGVETNLGKIPMPPRMKLKEIMRTYFRGSTDDEESEVSMAVAAGMELVNWMEKQGWAHPPVLLHMDKLLLQYSLVKTTRRLTFDITWQADRVSFGGDDDGDYYRFTASNGYEVISRSRMDIQTERIWLLGAKRNEETRSGSMVFSSDEKRDSAYTQFNIALAEWAASHGGTVHLVQ